MKTLKFILGIIISLSIYTYQNNRACAGNEVKENSIPSLLDRASVYNASGEKQQALSLYQQALKLADGNIQSSQILKSIAALYDSIGEKQLALDAYQQSLQILEKTNDTSTTAQTLIAIGTFYQNLGEKQLALDYYNRANRIIRDENGFARDIEILGDAYLGLGANTQALGRYNVIFAQNRENLLDRAPILLKIAKVYNLINKDDLALQFYHRALEISQQIQNYRLSATILFELGLINSKLKQTQTSIDYYNRARELSKTLKDLPSEGNILLELGNIYADSDRNSLAFSAYGEAISIFERIGDTSQQALSLYRLARLQYQLKERDRAKIEIEKALNIVESVRRKLVNPDLRAAYFSTVQNYYQFYIDLLMEMHRSNPEQGYHRIALQTSERSRARSLLELLNEANANIRNGVEPELLTRAQNLQQQLDAIEKRRLELVNLNSTEVQIATIETEMQELLDRYRDIQTQIRAKSPRYAAITQPEPLDVNSIQKLLDRDTVLLQYSLSSPYSYLWVVTQDNFSSYQLGDREQIETLAREWRDELTKPEAIVNYQTEIGKNLSAKIFPPALLGLKKKRIVIVGDGILQYIPFAALPIADSKKITLIDRHEVINLPSSSTLAMLRQKRDLDTQKSKTLAIFADPVFSLEDERVTIKPNNNSDAIAQTDINLISLNRSQKELNLEDWDRLKWTGIEANKILNLVSPTQRKEFLNFDADLSQLKEVELGKYKIVHFATHGLVNTESPELSGLVLSLLDRNGRAKNRFLRLHEIYNLNLSATEIVVLSACQTGLGQEIRGEGLVGLTRGFMYAGAKRVLVSLWSVDDRATAELMERFYYYLLEKKLSATEALKAAQVQLKNIYPNPYYWAGFVIQGDWR